MSGKRVWLAGLAILVIAGLAVAWSMLDTPWDADTLAAELEDGACGKQPGPGPLDSTDGSAPEESASKPGVDAPTEPGAPESDRSADPERLDPSRADQPGGGLAPIRTSESEPGPLAPVPSTPDPVPGTDPPSARVGLPGSARDPTPRESAAKARYYNPARLPKAAAMPESAETESEVLPLDMTKLAEPEVWAEYWSREGYLPPAMVKTPVRGKLMSQLTNTQVFGAKVRVFTFFPATNLLSGPVLPLVMEALTNEQGFFEANLPTPQIWPGDYPRFALNFEFEGKRIVDCATFNNLRGGESNEIGVFWAPHEPYELAVSAVNTEQGLTVAATGHLDPRRWETRRAKSIFPLFGPQPVSAGGSQLVGTWDFTGAPPFITLLRNGEPVLTRQCTRSADEVTRSALEQLTTTMVFEETTLDEVLAKLAAQGNFKIVRAEAVDGEMAVSLAIGHVKIRQALDLVTDFSDLSWRIEGGVVIVDEAGKAPEADAAPEIRVPFDPVIFPNDGKLALSGTVVDDKGIALEGAILSLSLDGAPRVTYTDSSGWFSFSGLRDEAYSLSARHELFVEFNQTVQAGVTDLNLAFDQRKPRIPMRVVSDSTDQPVTNIWVRYFAWPDNTGIMDHLPSLQVRAMAASDGQYLFENELPLLGLTISAPGFKPFSVEYEDVAGVIEVRLTDGLKPERRPRDYSAVQEEALWQVDEGEGPGLWSLDDDHWVEYSIDFGEESKNFDLLLGVTNHTYGTLPLDNEYLFEVDVWVDGNKKGRLNIASDPAVAQLARLELGSLTGQHTIRLMWLNDRYIPGQLDANIRYESIRFIEVP